MFSPSETKMSVTPLFFIPEATPTRIFQKSTYPKVPEPENFVLLDTRSYPNPKFKPAGTRRV